MHLNIYVKILPNTWLVILCLEEWHKFLSVFDWSVLKYNVTLIITANGQYSVPFLAYFWELAIISHPHFSHFILPQPFKCWT